LTAVQESWKAAAAQCWSDRDFLRKAACGGAGRHHASRRHKWLSVLPLLQLRACGRQIVILADNLTAGT